MAIVRAKPCLGVHMSLSDLMAEREISQDLPAEVIGECVAEAVRDAWKAGHDPALDPFLVIVTFL